jgi:hypothetical protein
VNRQVLPIPEPGKGRLRRRTISLSLGTDRHGWMRAGLSSVKPDGPHLHHHLILKVFDRLSDVVGIAPASGPTLAHVPFLAVQGLEHPLQGHLPVRASGRNEGSGTEAAPW